MHGKGSGGLRCYSGCMVPETVAPVSVDEFWEVARRLERAELVGGQVVELAPLGFRHGEIAMTIGTLLHEHVTRGGLGAVVADTGFILSRDPPTVRAPDVAVVLAPRVPSPRPVRFFPGPPDLAVEVLSPDDRPGESTAKVADYLRAGTRAVWIVDPESRTVTVHTRGGATRYAVDETLDGAPVVPSLRLPIGIILGEPA